MTCAKTIAAAKRLLDEFETATHQAARGTSKDIYAREAAREALTAAIEALVEAPREEFENGVNAWLDNQHPDDAAVDAFAGKMRRKMAASRAKGRGGWDDKAQCSADDLSLMLREHVEKGDPVDVANFAMMLAQRGERIATPLASMAEEAARLFPSNAAATSTPCASGEAKKFVKRAMQLAQAYATCSIEDSRLESRESRAVVKKLFAALKAHTETALAATQAPAAPAFLKSTEQRDILVAALTAFSRDDRRNKHAREVANELRTAVAQALRTPTAGNTEDARSELVRDLAGRLSRATRASEKNDRDWLVSRDDVLAGRAALTQAASTGGKS